MASQFAEHGRRAWASDEPCWGIWSIPESELNVLSDVAGMDAVELGCGTGQGDFVSLEWARRWPSEEIWRALKR
jgi:hypothetical protein